MFCPGCGNGQAAFHDLFIGNAGHLTALANAITKLKQVKGFEIEFVLPDKSE